jgi:hypothetical protein
MPNLMLQTDKLNTRTPCVIVTRGASDKNVLQRIEIRTTGMRVKGVTKLLRWDNMLSIEHVIRTGSVPKRKPNDARPKAIVVVQGAALKLKKERITYVSVWKRMPKGAEHPIGNILTIGLTPEGVRLGRRRADVDKAKLTSWKDLVLTIRKKLEKVKQGERLQGQLSK